MYTISFKGLSLGNHLFDWTIDDSFFDAFDMSEIVQASISVALTMVKHSDFIELNFALNGWATVSCDRCLDPLKVEIASEPRMFVRFGKHAGEDDESDDDVIVLPYGEDSIDMAQYLYEYAHLSLPMRRVHPENGCNQEMLSKLEEFLVKS